MYSELAAWFDATERDLPWRRPGTTAWGTLVSEIMLQQTPAARVIEPYGRWMARWPDPAALARAPAADVLKQWGNLGYPRRALRLKECAQSIVDRFHGVVPRDVDALMSLPGVGAYTARAVAVFAYGEHHPVVDTNVRRVMARWLHGQSDQGRASTSRDLAEMSSIMPGPDTSPRFNAALMELGALVCTARSPRCDDCPLATTCLWRRNGYPNTGAPGVTKQAPYAGSDRQARGAILRALRETEGPLAEKVLSAAWPNDEQRERAILSLLNDGLIVTSGRGHFALPD